MACHKALVEGSEKAISPGTEDCVGSWETRLDDSCSTVRALGCTGAAGTADLEADDVEDGVRREGLVGRGCRWRLDSSGGSGVRVEDECEGSMRRKVWDL